MQGALAGMIGGTAFVIVWNNLLKPLGGIFDLYVLLPAFIFSFLLILVVSKLTPEPSDEIKNEFDHYTETNSEIEAKAQAQSVAVEKAAATALGNNED